MQFDFGRNWLAFSKQALCDDKVAQARTDFATLFAPLDLSNKLFLDIGFGQGLSMLLAQQAGARVVGCDINPTCLQALERTARFFEREALGRVPVVIGSILDETVTEELRQHPALGEQEGYDIVHSWGVLHHTGDMNRAIANASSLVRPRGHLVLAIYNRHWSSRAWLLIKWLYVHAPRWNQKALVGLLYPIIWLAKLAVTRRSPAEQSRGMDFHFNVVDWVGGYPYEYASPDEMKAKLAKLGFDCVAEHCAGVPTGCNEFVFQRS